MIEKGKVKYTGKKYLPLKEHMKKLNKNRVILSHKEIETILNDSLPKSAYEYKRFWSNKRANNQTSDHSNSWLEIGWEVEKVDLENEVIHFKTKE